MHNNQRGATGIEWMVIILLAGSLVLVGYIGFRNYQNKLQETNVAVCDPIDRTRGVCASDAAKICKSETGHDLESCLAMNLPNLTAECRLEIDPCREDMKKFCDSLTKGKERYKCLLEKATQTSALCQKSLAYHEQCKGS